ncbi:MAG: nucleotidyl transferase AbiEii/AbiGii toxin family protein [Gordonibacter sp.]
MPYLHENDSLFRLFVLNCATEMDMSPVFVVKDYYITMLLREIAAQNSYVCFKGGTSLSKSHRIINRFSEDIDLGMEQEHPTEGQRKAMKSSVCAAVETLGLEVSNLGETRSKRSFNRFLVPLPRFEQDDPDNILIVETALQTPIQPTVEKEISCFIGEYLEGSGRCEYILEYDLSPFPMQVSSIERTFVDKVFAICDYYLDGKTTDRQSRHIYDLSMMLSSVTLDDSLLRLFNIVRHQRRGQFMCASAEDGVDLAAIIESISVGGVYRDDYEAVTLPLLFEQISYGEASSCLVAISDFLSHGRNV